MKWKTCVAALALWWAGCGDGAPIEAPFDEETSGEENTAEQEDAPQITGLLGRIAPDQVEAALNPRIGRLQRCLDARSEDVEFLGGNIRFSFRIRTDGSVIWVYLVETEIGDRQAEQCMLEVARSTRFARPHGGEAEFAWGLGFDPPEDVRPPLAWNADSLGNRLRQVGALARECNAQGSFRVTAYIQPGGRILSAGGAPPSAEAEPALDCILERVRALHMPDPGSYAAKVSFAVE